MVICSSVFLSSKTPSAYGLKASAWKPAETYPWELLRPSSPTPQADATLTDGAASNTMVRGPGEGTENKCTGVCLHGGFSWRRFCLPPWEARFRTSCVTLSSDPYYWPTPPHIFIKHNWGQCCQERRQYMNLLSGQRVFLIKLLGKGWKVYNVLVLALLPVKHVFFQLCSASVPSIKPRSQTRSPTALRGFASVKDRPAAPALTCPFTESQAPCSC